MRALRALRRNARTHVSDDILCESAIDFTIVPSVAEMRERINAAMAPGAARNAIDCALWDLEARTTGVRAWRLAGLARPAPALTAYTISLGSPASHGARRATGGATVTETEAGRRRCGAHRGGARGRPARAAHRRRQRIVDGDSWATNVAACIAARVELVEQPFPATRTEFSKALRGPCRSAPMKARMMGRRLPGSRLATTPSTSSSTRPAD